MKRTSWFLLLLLVSFTACTSSSPKDLLAAPLGERSSEVSDEAAVIPPECEQYFSSAAQIGLSVPAGWSVLCPAGAIDERGRSHWGITCYGGACPEGQGPYISINLSKIGPNKAIRDYVVRHELCHAAGFRAEAQADQCAEDRGASMKYSPYR